MAQNGEIKAQAGTYGGFIRFVKIGTTVTLLVAALVVWLIAS